MKVGRITQLTDGGGCVAGCKNHDLQAAWVEMQALKVENRRLLLALNMIANTPHCDYENNENSNYGIGVADGHRCAAQTARTALQPSPDDSQDRDPPPESCEKG